MERKYLKLILMTDYLENNIFIQVPYLYFLNKKLYVLKNKIQYAKVKSRRKYIYEWQELQQRKPREEKSHKHFMGKIKFRYKESIL